MMKKTIIFKTLVDVLFILNILVIFSFLFILPFGTTKFTKLDYVEWGIYEWLILLMEIISYILLVIGLYFLRKMAHVLLSGKYFSLKVISNLNKAGNTFILSGAISILIQIICFIVRITNGELGVNYDTNSFYALFILIIGLFFKIQSNALSLAKNINEENKLTI